PMISKLWLVSASAGKVKASSAEIPISTIFAHGRRPFMASMAGPCVGAVCSNRAAPPMAGSSSPLATTASAPTYLARCALAGEVGLVRRGGDRDAVVAGGLRELDAEVADTADTEHGDARPRLGVRASQRGPYGVAGADRWRGQLVADPIREQHGAVRIGGDVL